MGVIATERRLRRDSVLELQVRSTPVAVVERVLSVCPFVRNKCAVTHRAITSRGDRDWIAPHPSGGRTTLLVDRVGGTEVRVEDLTVTSDVPLHQYWEATLRESRCLDVEFLVGFEMVGEFSQEFGGHDAALVVWEAVLPRLVHFEVIVPPDGEFALVGDLPVERPEAVALTELADCLWIRYDRAD
uniref:Uncharacterized protein n=1 Tax=uncultured haloarchaeon TaxID=160804 RepID=A5YS93_9EURY|nr:hypothetical protein [uncultured haloarchaeon]